MTNLWAGIALPAAVLAMTGSVEAGQERGGGNAVVCYAGARGSSTPTSVQLFDHWEQSRQLSQGYPLQMAGSGATVQEKLEAVLTRLEGFDPERAGRYRLRAREVLDRLDEYLVEGIRLSELDDDQPLALPEPPCYKERFAVQVVDPATHQKKFLIDRDLYASPLIDDDSRAGLLLHEIIYEEALDRGQKTSDQVRYFNYLISSDFLSRATFEQYGRLAVEVGFQGLEKLKVIGLHALTLKDLPEGLFRGLKFLEGINLSRNRLTALPPKIFRDLERLKWIALDSNRFEHLQNPLFKNSPLLERIDLQENRISQIDGSVFYGTSSLQSVDLRDNPLSEESRASLLGALGGRVRF